MAFSWYVYTPLEPKEALALEDRLRERLDALFRARPTLVPKGPAWGDVTVEEAVPSADDVAELSEAYGREVSDEVLDRLDGCRSALSVERNGVRELDPLQVSILRYLLEQVPNCLVDWGDMQIVLAEDILVDVDEYASAGNLNNLSGVYDPAPTESAPEAAPVETEGLVRATETETALETITADPFLRRRFERRLEDDYPEFVEKYVASLEARGPVGDEAAATELGVGREALDPMLAKLRDMAVGLAEEADED